MSGRKSEEGKGEGKGGMASQEGTLSAEQKKEPTEPTGQCEVRATWLRPGQGMGCGEGREKDDPQIVDAAGACDGGKSTRGGGQGV